MSTTTKLVIPIGCPLSQREYETMNWIASGRTYKEAALYMGIAVSGVRSHVHNSLGKLGVVDSKQAAVMMVKKGWWKNPLDQDDQPLPPFAHPYLDALDRHLADGEDEKAKRDMRIAGLGLAGTKAANERDREAFLDRVIDGMIRL